MEKKTERRARPKPRSLMNTKKNEKRSKGLNAVDKHISEGWHKIDGTQIHDLEKYIYDYLASCDQYDQMEIMIGTDGASHGAGPKEDGPKSIVKLLSVICFRKVGKGVHVIKRRETHTVNWRVLTGEKLNMEVNKTYELVQHLASIGVKPKVHLDLNPDPQHESFNVYNVVRGWFESMGYETEYKPESAAAMCASDYWL